MSLINEEFVKLIDSEVPQEDSTSFGEKLFIYGLVRAFEPEVLLEVGTHRGKTALYIAQAILDNGKGHLFTVDPFDWDARGNFRKFPQQEAVITWLQIKGKDFKLPQGETRGIDFIFLDGFHEKEVVLEELDALLPQLSEHGIIVFHDCALEGSPSCDPGGAIKEKGLKTVWIPTQNKLRIYEKSEV